MENKLGRLLRKNEIVHHRDGNKENDAVRNLAVLDNAEHSRRHRQTDVRVSFLCVCEKVVLLKPYAFKHKLRQPRKLPLFCSRECYKNFVRGKEMVSVKSHKL